MTKTYLEALKEAVGAAVCVAAVDLDRTSNFIFGTPRGSISGAACNDPTPSPPLTPPFSGGQCPDRYRINWAFDGFEPGTCNLVPSSPNPRQRFRGPIRGMELRRIDPDICGGVGGNQVVLLHSNDDGSPAESVFLNSTASRPSYANPRITSVVNLDGPDDCGDPPIPPPEPPPTQPISFTYVNNQGDNVTVSGDVNIGIPILIAPFTLVAPVKVDLGGQTFNGSVTLSPDFDVTLSPTFGGGGGNTDPTEPIEPEPDDPDPDDPDEPSECEDAPLKGLLVSLNFTPEMRATEVRQDGSLSSLAVPRAAIIYFIAKVGNRSVYMPGVDLKSRSQYVPVPYNAIVTCWRIHTEPGISVASTRPVFDIPTQ